MSISGSRGLANRMAQIRPFYVMELLARARELESQGRSIIHMEVGEPDFPTPDPILEAGKEALDQGLTRYTPATGIPELRQAIARFYRDAFRMDLDPARVIVTPGSSGALQLVMSVLVNPGDEVLMADPGYPCNRNFVRQVSGEPVSLPVGSESDYQLTSEMVRRFWSDKTRAVMIASPSNPTGTLIPEKGLEQIHSRVHERGGSLIVDEIYQGLVYGEAPRTALSISDDIFVINSFSKFFGMTGWRLGWVVAPENYLDAIDRLAQNIFLSPPTMAQYAALRAFDADTMAILEQRREAFMERRDFLLPALKSLGFEIPVAPAGAFYLYANCAALTDDSYRFAMDLLESEGVATTPGKDFGNNRPEQHLRFAYTTEISRLQEGVDRIAHFLSAA